MLLKINHLSKSYGNVQPLKDVNCEISKGEVISIIGPSGTGKSTFINCINQLEKPDSGEIWFDGKNILEKGTDLSALRRKIGMVFQSFNLFAHMTIIENIMRAPTDLLGISKQEAYNEAMALLETVGLKDKALSYPSELSGGQQQRIAIVRALAMKPEIMLFDEPTSALDPTMVDEVLYVIKNLAHKGLTMLIVTHEMRFAREISSRIFYMDEGEIYEQGKPEQVFENPQREKTRYFVQRLKVLSKEIELGHFDYPAFITEMKTFAQKQMMSTKETNNTILVFEELCLGIISKAFDKFVVTLGYSSQNEKAELTILYEGREFNPLSDDADVDIISKKLIMAYVEKFQHSYTIGKNTLHLELCERKSSKK